MAARSFSDASGSESEGELNGPVQVSYCPVCSMPYEYCEWGPSPALCREQLAKEDPDLFKELYEGVEGLEVKEGEKKKQTRGGKGVVKIPKKSAAAKPAGIQVTIIQRQKRKFVTSVVGFKGYGINLKKASKALAGRFSASGSVAGDDEVQVQGDHFYDIEDFIVSTYPNISRDDISVAKGKK